MPTGISLSADHVATYEPQRRNNFFVDILPPRLLGGSGASIFMHVNEASIPTEESEALPINFGNERRVIAGRTTIAESTLQIYDYVDMQVADFFLKWRRLIYNPGPAGLGGLPIGGIGYARNYKTEGYIMMVDCQGERARIWDLIGCWPRSVQFGTFSMTDSGVNMINVTLSVDKLVRTPGTITY